MSVFGDFLIGQLSTTEATIDELRDECVRLRTELAKATTKPMPPSGHNTMTTHERAKLDDEIKRLYQAIQGLERLRDADYGRGCAMEGVDHHAQARSGETSGASAQADDKGAHSGTRGKARTYQGDGIEPRLTLEISNQRGRCQWHDCVLVERLPEHPHTYFCFPCAEEVQARRRRLKQLAAEPTKGAKT